MERSKERLRARLRRHRRVRQKVRGRDGQPRLAVFRSGRHIYAQIIDDSRGQTLFTVSTLDSEIKSTLAGIKKTEQAQKVGELLARRAMAGGIKKVVFDRGGYLYHGQVKALAEGARKTGLEF